MGAVRPRNHLTTKSMAGSVTGSPSSRPRRCPWAATRLSFSPPRRGVHA